MNGCSGKNSDKANKNNCKTFSYTICNSSDNEAFYKQCALLERNIKDLKTETDLQDVDGSLVRKYFCKQGTISIYNDAQIDAVYIDSDFDVALYLLKNK